jgi:hypothetical protein
MLIINDIYLLLLLCSKSYPWNVKITGKGVRELVVNFLLEVWCCVLFFRYIRYIFLF